MEFTPEPDQIRGIANNQELTQENTTLKLQLIKLAQRNRELQRVIDSQNDENYALREQISALQISFDTEIQAYQQQLKVMEQNEGVLRQQLAEQYSNDRVEVMRELGLRYIEDIDQVKLEIVQQQRQLFNEQLEKMKVDLTQNFTFLLQVKEQQLINLKQANTALKAHEREKYRKLRDAYQQLKNKAYRLAGLELCQEEHEYMELDPAE